MRAGPGRAGRHPAAARRLRQAGQLRARTPRRGRSWARARRSPARTAAEEILDAFEHDRARLRRVQPASTRAWCSRSSSELHLVELAVERSLLTGMPPDRVSASIAVLRLPLPLASCSTRGVVAPDDACRRRMEDEPTSGGHVLRAATRGSTATCWSSTSRASTRASSAPSRSIRWAYVPRPERRVTIRSSRPTAPPSAAQAGILPGLLDELVPAAGGGQGGRRPGRQPGDQDPDELVLRRAGHPGLPLRRAALANAITGFGQRDPALVARADRGARATRCSTATRTACSCCPASTTPPSARSARRRGSPPTSTASCPSTSPEPGASRADWSWSSNGSTCACCCPRCATAAAGARKRYAGLIEEGRADRGRLHGHGGGAPGLDEAGQAGAARALQRLFAERPVEEYLRDRGRAVARRASSTSCSSTARRCARSWTATPPPRRLTWSPRAR